MKLSAELHSFAERVGYAFADPTLLITAVTHASRQSADRSNNERFEFLGDRVLGLVMAEALLQADPTASEGLLAPRLNALVRKETCAEVARAFGLGDVLRLGRSEMISGGRRKDALLGDGLEAVIAAVYLDGGFGAARRVVLEMWGSRIETVDADARDAKTALQEWSQAQLGAAPTYSEVSREGPDHAPVFTIEVKLKSGETEIAKAGSKRQAEQAAARTMLGKVGATS